MGEPPGGFYKLSRKQTDQQSLKLTLQCTEKSSEHWQFGRVPKITAGALQHLEETHKKYDR